MASSPTGLQPKLFRFSQNEIEDGPVNDVQLRVPTDIAAPQYGLPSIAVIGKNPLLTEWIFKVADALAAACSVDYRRVAT